MNRKFMKKIGIALLVSVLLVLMAVPVQADNINYTTIRAKGRTYYLSIEFNRKYQMRSRLYQKTSSGKKVVAATGFANEKRLEYVGTYGNKLYFSYKYNKRIRTYSYTIGKSGFKLENGSLYLQAMRGNYAYGYRQIPDDNSPTKLYIYNVATRKSTYIGLGYFSDIKYIGGKIYYVRYSNRYRTAYIMRCNPNGTGKKILKTLKNKYPMYVFTIGKNRATYYIDRNDEYREASVRY